jgi:hypothetical protein
VLEPWVKPWIHAGRSADTAGWVVVALATALCVALVVAWYEPSAVYNDSFQLASVARNLLDGHGLSTSIVYYDSQYAAGTMPAAQTVWPPGMPAAVAALAYLGLDTDRAMFVVSLAGYAACPFLAASILRRIDTTPSSGTFLRWVAVALVPLLTAANAYVAVRAGTDGPFIAFSLLALLGYLKCSASSKKRASAMALIAAGVTGAIAFRYAGLFLLAAVAVTFLVEAWGVRSWRVVRDGVVALAVPAIFAAALLVRNVIDAGNASGGMEARAWAPAGDVLKSTAAAVFALSGLTLQSYWQRLALLVLVSFVAGSLVRGAWLAATGLMSARSTQASEVSPGIKAWIFAATYVAATFLALVLVTFQRGADTLIDRYFLPLVPFVALACAIAWIPGALSARESRFLTTRAAWPSFTVTAWAALAVASFGVGQSRDLHRRAEALRTDEARAVVMRGLEQRIGGETIAAWLAKRASVMHPLLSSSGQLVGGLTRLPVLALAPSVFSEHQWTTAEVREIVASYGVCHVLLHRLDTEGGGSTGRQFFADLRAGRVPDWLRLVHESAPIVVYGVKARGCDDN